MSKKLSHTIIFFLLILGSNSCVQDVDLSKQENYFFVDVGGALLPVLAAGNPQSNVAIIFVHGGPGNSGLVFRQDKGLFDLEQDYRMIYYDQRASGMTQGNSGSDEITIEQFSEDLNVIVDFTKEVVGAEIVYIIGHSWGGGLSTYYLLDQQHQDKVNGYIAVAPAFNVVKAMENSRLGMMAVATAFVNLNVRKQYWQGALNFYNANPVITQSVFADHLAYVEEADGVNFSQAQEVSIDLPDYQLQAFLQNILYTNENMTIGGDSIFDAMQLDNQMASITLPIFLMWGEKDGLIPVAQNVDFYDAVGTVDNEFFYLGYPLSAHEPFAEEPTTFTTKVGEFVELFR